MFGLASTSRLAALLSLLLVVNEWIPRFRASLGVRAPIAAPQSDLKGKVSEADVSVSAVVSPGCRRSRLRSMARPTSVIFMVIWRAFALRLESSVVTLKELVLHKILQVRVRESGACSR